MISEETLIGLERALDVGEKSTPADVARILIREIRSLKSTIEHIHGEWDFQWSMSDRIIKARDNEIAELKAQLKALTENKSDV